MAGGREGRRGSRREGWQGRREIEKVEEEGGEVGGRDFSDSSDLHMTSLVTMATHRVDGALHFFKRKRKKELTLFGDGDAIYVLVKKNKR